MEVTTTMPDSITIPATFVLALSGLTIYLLGFCFYLFKKWQKANELSESWELKARHNYMRNSL
jgi:hypothetical protein